MKTKSQFSHFFQKRQLYTYVLYKYLIYCDEYLYITSGAQLKYCMIYIILYIPTQYIKRLTKIMYCTMALSWSNCMQNHLNLISFQPCAPNSYSSCHISFQNYLTSSAVGNLGTIFLNKSSSRVIYKYYILKSEIYPLEIINLPNLSNSPFAKLIGNNSLELLQFLHVT